MAQQNTKANSALALVLASIAGFIDVVGYLTLHGVFTAHMTGNTSKLGIAIGHGDPSAAVPLVAALLLFAAGIALGTVITDTDHRWIALAVEAGLVGGFMLYAPSVVRDGSVVDHGLSGFYLLLALAAVALGIQTAALTQIQGETVRTSYISGVVTNLAQSTTRRLYDRSQDGARARLLLGVCLCYLAGAIVAAYGLVHVGTWCLAGPVAVLLVAAALDCWLQP